MVTCETEARPNMHGVREGLWEIHVVQSEIITGHL